MNNTYLSKSAVETEAIAEKTAKANKSPHTFCLQGDLGAGKTAFARGLARGYGYSGRVWSPTFTIMNIYEGSTIINHYDFYRLSSEEELFDIGFEPFSDDSVIIVEWFDSFAHLFSGGATLVKILKTENDDHRLIEIEDLRL